MLQRLANAILRDTQSYQDSSNLRSRLRARHVIEPCCIEEILHRRELLEERGLNAHTVDDALHHALVLLNIVPKDAHVPGIRDEQGREDANEGRFPRTIRAQDAHDLTSLDAHGHIINGAHFALPLLFLHSSRPAKQGFGLFEYL